MTEATIILCRACLAPRASFNLRDGILREVLSLCIPLENRNLPEAVCGECRRILLKFHRFRLKVQRVHSTLRNAVFGDNVGKRPVKLSKRKGRKKGSRKILTADSEKSSNEDIESESGHNPSESDPLNDVYYCVEVTKESEDVEDDFNKKSKCLKEIKQDSEAESLNVNEASKSKKSGHTPVIRSSLTAETSVSNPIVTATPEILQTGPVKTMSRGYRRAMTSGNVCSHCGYRATDRCSLLVHIRRHTGDRPFKCSVCPKSFTVAGNLKMHSRVHTGERPFVCERCGRAFAAAASLRGHARRHDGEKPHACAPCGRRFTLLSNLRRHERTHSGAKPYTCEICGRAFASSPDVRVHRRTHTGERPHACAHCPRRFASDANRRAHELSHAVPPCFVCGDTFDSKLERSAHLKTHQIKRRRVKEPISEEYYCDQCGKKFLRRYNLIVHKKRNMCAELPRKYKVSSNADTAPATNRSRGRDNIKNPNAVVRRPMLKDKEKEGAQNSKSVPITQLACAAPNTTITTVTVPITYVPITILGL